MQKTYISLFILLILVVITGIIFSTRKDIVEVYKLNDERLEEKKQWNLSSYKIENLKYYSPKSPKITVGNLYYEDEIQKIYKIYLEFNPDPDDPEQKTVSGLLSYPASKTCTTEKFPLVLMFRGYVDQKTYQPGIGTKNAARTINENCYMSLSLDFLGYGESDPESANIFKTRFQTYTTAISAYYALDQIQSWDQNNLYLWAHSNGGQIALVFLESVNRHVPSALWAPVTASFPYSVLFYTDQSEDGGKLIRKNLAKLEMYNDTNNFSPDKYYESIDSPIFIAWGTADDSVPKTWIDKVQDDFNQADVDFTLKVYQQADHNLNPHWDMVVKDTLDFYKNY